MARSTGTVAGRVKPGSFHHAASGTDYTIAADGSVTMVRRGKRTREQFDFAIGSGAAGFSYLLFRDRFLYQAPITWYSQVGRWDAAPGYEGSAEMPWNRPVDPSCLLCHASQLTHIYGTFNRYADPPFRQNGVSCERCHGPASEHITSGANLIVPSKLAADGRDDVCRQCHLMGEARIPREGRAFAEYRPGQRLADFVAYFVYDDPAGPSLRTTSHEQKLLVSRCKQSSGEAMWCGTCHDVHGIPVDAVAWFREKCLACHTPDPCRRGPDCTGCHMPKSKATDAGHGAFTDHSIPRRPQRPAAPREMPWKLRPYTPADAGTRELGQAYLLLYQRTGDERQRQEAARLLGLR